VSKVTRLITSILFSDRLVNAFLNKVGIVALRIRNWAFFSPAVSRSSLPSFGGDVYIRGEADYNLHAYQYASTSNKTEGEKGNYMEPLFIVVPKPDADPDHDVQLCLDYCLRHGVALAVRTGGHQYTGASSTSGRNIQLDLSVAYNDFSVVDEASRIVVTGISHQLGDLNALLGSNHLFVPHGQCFHVNAGGHMHTGMDRRRHFH